MKVNFWNLCLIFIFLLIGPGCSNKIPYSFPENGIDLYEKTQVVNHINLIASTDSSILVKLEPNSIIEKENAFENQNRPQVYSKGNLKGKFEKEPKPNIPQKRIIKKLEKKEIANDRIIGKTLLVFLAIYFIAIIVTAIFVNFWLGLLMLPLLLVLLCIMGLITDSTFSLEPALGFIFIALMGPNGLN